MKISELDDKQLATLIENRWKSSETVWDIVKKVYDANLKAYKNDPDWLKDLPRKKSKVRANRIFVDMEAVINTLIANPPKPNMLPARPTEEARLQATQKEKYFQIKYDERNVKETLRKGLRNLYLSRLIVLKPFWNAKINDFDVIAVDPRKVRIGKTATKEADSEFCIEEVSDSLSAVLRRFPAKQKEILAKHGMALGEKGEIPAQVLIDNPEVTYKEAWIRDSLICKYDDIVLDKGPNPYWDWQGVLLSEDEHAQLKEANPDQLRLIMQNAKTQQEQRFAQKQQQAGQPEPTQQGDMPPLEGADTSLSYSAYYFNHFDQPRKPYILATAFNNENSPIGQTDMITQAAPLQENVDETKRDIITNARVVNGVWKIDASVMTQAEAQKVQPDADGRIWGKGVAKGVARETGPALPAFVVENMQDSRQEIDNIMAASSAFRGERQGTETKGGRLALVDQSYLRLNELVQVVDYVNYELFNWFYQLAKVRYTEHHYAKTMGKDMAAQLITLSQDDFEDGEEVRVIAGKQLPEDREFRFEMAQKDVAAGLLSPVDYFEIAGYNTYSPPKELAKNAFMFRAAPSVAVGMTPEEMQKIPPPIPQSQLREQVAFDDLPAAAKVQFLARMGITITEDQAGMTGAESIAIAFKDMPPDAQLQLLQKLGIQADVHLLLAEKMAQRAHEQSAQHRELDIKAKQADKPPATPAAKK
jgi:hypothetical protein